MVITLDCAIPPKLSRLVGSYCYKHYKIRLIGSLVCRVRVSRTISIRPTHESLCIQHRLVQQAEAGLASRLLNVVQQMCIQVCANQSGLRQSAHIYRQSSPAYGIIYLYFWHLHIYTAVMASPHILQQFWHLHTADLTVMRNIFDGNILINYIAAILHVSFLKAVLQILASHR